jgi:hypothetical protein
MQKLNLVKTSKLTIVTKYRYIDYDSDEDAAMLSQLKKIEKQDVNYKEKIMKQNKEDLQKADTVKAQKKIFEAIVGQRMIIHNNLTKANQFPQHE